MTLMFHTLIHVAALATALVALPPAATAQDFDKGYEFFQTGNYEAALKEWRPIAEQGNVLAQFSLGILYYNYFKADGALKDAKEALHWFRAGAEKGQPNAQTMLGVMHYGGKGVLTNTIEAMRWFRLAAFQGDALAQEWLGATLSEGRGIPKNDVGAYMWYNIAATNGSQEAGKLRDHLETTMTPEQIAQAVHKAKTCLSSNYTDCD